MSRNVSSPRFGSDREPAPYLAATDRSVVPLNEHAALYLTLAEEIIGAAVGMSPNAQRLLRIGLVERFGDLFQSRGDDAVDELLRLATQTQAA